MTTKNQTSYASVPSGNGPTTRTASGCDGQGSRAKRMEACVRAVADCCNPDEPIGAITVYDDYGHRLGFLPEVACDLFPPAVPPTLTAGEAGELEEWLSGANPIFRERVLAVARAAVNP